MANEPWTQAMYQQWAEWRRERDEVMARIVEHDEAVAELERWLVFAHGWCEALRWNSSEALGHSMAWHDALLRAYDLEIECERVRRLRDELHESLVRMLTGEAAS